MQDSFLRIGMLFRSGGINHLVGGVDRYVQISGKTFCGIPVDPDFMQGKPMDLCESFFRNEKRCREMEVCRDCLEQLSRYCS